MIPRLFALVLFAALIGAGVPDVRSFREAVAQDVVYLPLAAAAPAPVEVVVTASGVECPECYPSYSYVRGYLRHIPGAPIAHVTLEVDITVYPYEPAGAASYTSTATFAPVFAVTLPDQVNPFAYVVVNGKGFTAVGSVVRVASVTPVSAAERYYPLAARSWERSGDQVRGMLRNDSPATLSDLRAGLFSPDACGWQAAHLNVTVVQPGEIATAEVWYPCVNEEYVFLGQGRAE